MPMTVMSQFYEVPLLPKFSPSVFSLMVLAFLLMVLTFLYIQPSFFLIWCLDFINGAYCKCCLCFLKW